MARNLQKLINFHGSLKSALDASASSLYMGEIAVVHNSDEKQCFLAINTSAGTDSKLVYFVSSGAVADAITSFSGDVVSYIDNMGSDQTTLSSTTIALEEAVSGLTSSAKTAVQSVKASATTGSVTSQYIEATTATTGGDFEKEVAVGVKIDVAESLGEIASDSKQLANAYAVQEYVKSVSGNIETRIDSVSNNLNDKIGEAYDSAVTYTDAQISGITSGIIKDIKDSLSDVYTYKSSVSTYADLPDAATYTGKSGDVYNVVNASGVPGTADYIAAGTNFAYVSGETAEELHWDALGGTIDLGNYYDSAQTNTAIENYGDHVLASAKTYTDQVVSGLNMSQYITSAVAETAIETAVTEGVAEANDYTDEQISAISGVLQSNYWTSGEVMSHINDITTNVEGKLNDVSGYSKNDYIELVNEAHVSGDSIVDKFTVELQVAEAISAVTGTGKVADAKDVKDYVDAAKNAAVTSAYTQASADNYTLQTELQGLIDDVDEKVDNLVTANTVQSAVTAVTFDSLTEGASGVVGGDTGNEHESGVAAKVDNNVLTLDFDSLVIDCGTFGD